MKKDQKPLPDSVRRNFLRGSVATGLGVAMTASLPGTALADDAEQPEAQKNSGYRLSGHVLDYYKTLTS